MSKLPQITIFFWIMKICATTLGETAGDAFSMSMDLGYLVSTAIFAVIVIAAVALHIRAKQFNPFLYWFTIIAKPPSEQLLLILPRGRLALVTRAVRLFC